MDDGGDMMDLGGGGDHGSGDAFTDRLMDYTVCLVTVLCAICYLIMLEVSSIDFVAGQSLV